MVTTKSLQSKAASSTTRRKSTKSVRESSSRFTPSKRGNALIEVGELQAELDALMTKLVDKARADAKAGYITSTQANSQIKYLGDIQHSLDVGCARIWGEFRAAEEKLKNRTKTQEKFTQERKVMHTRYLDKEIKLLKTKLEPLRAMAFLKV